MTLGARKWHLSLVIFAIFLVSIFAIKVRPLQKKGASLIREYREKIASKESFVSRAVGPPTEMLKASVKEEGESLQNAYGAGVKRLNLIKPELLPEGTSRPGIYWLDVLRKTRRGLLSQAGRDVDIPRGLSFPDNMPPPDEDEVPELLRTLRIIEEVLTLAIKSGMKSVADIRAGDKEIIESSGALFLEKASLSFSMEGNLESLVRFIHFLQEADSFYVIEDIDIQTIESTDFRSEGEILKVTLTLCMAYMAQNIDEVAKVSIPDSGK